MRCFKKKAPQKRKILFHCPPLEVPNDLYQTSKFPSNYIRTTKYTFWTFLPLVLIFEVSKISNIYFIAMAIINLIPQISIFSPASSIFPIVLILTISLTKQLIETLAAYVRDKHENKKRCRVLTGDNQIVEKNFGKLVVGDVVVLSHGDYIPADCILLATSQPDGLCYMETSSLDGEKNLKCRQTVKETFASATYRPENDTWMFNSSFVLTCDPPDQNLTKFVGHISFVEDGVVGSASSDLTFKNFLYKGSSVQMVKSCLGLVVYSGPQTKIQLNIQKPHNKTSLLEILINRKVLYLAVIQVTISTIFVIFKAVTPDVSFETNVLQTSIPLVITFFQYIILMSNLVPISLFVNIEIIRLIQSLFMRASNELASVKSKIKTVDGKPKKLEERVPCEVNNFTLADELGRVEFILSDKTGTLTKNRLTLDAIWVAGEIFGGNVSGSDPTNFKFQKHTCGLSLEARQLLERETGHANKFTFYDNNLMMCLDSDQADKSLQENYVIRCNPSEVPQNVSFMEGRSVFSKREVQRSDIPDSFTDGSKIDSEKMPHVKQMPGLWQDSRQASINLKDPKESIEETPRKVSEKSLAPGVLREYTHLSQIAKEMVRALAMCHSCMVQKNSDPEKPDKYSGTSPDEVCILKGVRCMGYEFMGDVRGNRNFNSLTHGLFNYRKVMDMEFTSERAMQSIVFYDDVNRVYFMYCKGSDNRILGICNDATPLYKEEANKSAEQFARMGFRCLFYGFRYFTEEQWKKVAQEYENAKTSADAAVAVKQFCADHLETDVNFLGFIVIQDELQDEVGECVEKLRNAEIKVWVVTGDKFETALTISKSANIISERERITQIRNGRDDPGLERIIAEHEQFQRMEGKSDYSLVVDMMSFSMEALEHSKVKKLFMNAKGVVCARSSPLAKGQLVRFLKKEKKCVLGIGDGENDVNMISEANIGVGVYGKEGTQATKVSDFAIGEFKLLWILVLFYGRINYMRTSNYVIIYLFKNIILVGIQFLFGFFSLASGMSFLDPWFLSVYNSVLNAFPHLYIGIFDVDIHYIKKGKNSSIFTPTVLAIAAPNAPPNPPSESTPNAPPNATPTVPPKADDDSELSPINHSGSSKTHTKFYIKKIIKDNYWLLFHESQLNRYFSEWIFWANTIYAFLLSAVIVIFSYLQIAFENPGNKALGFGEFSLAISLLLMVTVDITYMLRAKCADFGLLLSIFFLSILPTIAYTLIYDRIRGSLVFDSLRTLFSNGQFYLIFVILVTFYVVCEILFHIVLDEVSQPFYYKLLAMEDSGAKSGKFNNLTNLEKIVKKYRKDQIGRQVSLRSAQSITGWLAKSKSAKFKRRTSFL